MYYNTFNSTRFKLVFPEIVEKNITELQRRKQEEKDMSMFEKGRSLGEGSTREGYRGQRYS